MTRLMRLLAAACAISLSASLGLAAQARTFVYAGIGSYSIVEKYNLSRYDDGKYTGHLYREIRSVIAPSVGGVYEGDFFVLEETLRDLAKAAASVDAALRSSFSVDARGVYTMRGEDSGYPDWRDFPTFSKDPVSPGDKWQAYATRVIDPERKGVPTRIRVYVDYQYKGMSTYSGRPTYVIHAKFATRYKRGQDPNGDPELASCDGTHDIDIVIDAETGRFLIMTDTMYETYTWNSGKTLALKGVGFILFEAVAGMDERSMVDEIRDRLDDSGVAGVDVREDADGSGVLLTLNALQFQPDSAELMPGESARLDAIAKALAAIPGRTFLVTGHTANVGMPAHEAELSEQRAKRIVDELVKRGIPAERFLYMGFGSTRPVAPNDSEENRAKNRRVEITILED